MTSARSKQTERWPVRARTGGLTCWFSRRSHPPAPPAPQGLRTLPAHSPSPDLTSGWASAAPARDLPRRRPSSRAGPSPASQLPAPPHSLLADKPGQTAGPACPRSRASSAKPGGAEGRGRVTHPGASGLQGPPAPGGDRVPARLASPGTQGTRCPALFPKCRS